MGKASFIATVGPHAPPLSDLHGQRLRLGGISHHSVTIARQPTRRSGALVYQRIAFVAMRARPSTGRRRQRAGPHRGISAKNRRIINNSRTFTSGFTSPSSSRAT